MIKLIRELRRRQVFRATGLYIGGAWIVLQAADIVLPAYDAPEWLFRALITVAFIGLPIAIALAWMFDLTKSGIHLETDAEHAPSLPSGRKADFVVIGVLLVALSGSLIANFAPRDPVLAEVIDPVSILIADFANRTGDSVFDGALEQALTIGIEESSFITAFDRTTASGVLSAIDEQSSLDANGARLVSVREGIGIVVSGELTAEDSDYELAIDAINPDDGAILAEFRQRASGKSAVLTAVGELALSLREELGDVTVDNSAEGEETFTTVSLEAMHDYVQAQRLARDGKDDEAIGLYESAVEKDPQFGRAWSGLAVSAYKLGRTDVSEDAWQKTLSLLDGMTERERFRTEGVYYSLVARNNQKAIEQYAKLVERYPADDAGHNNLAVAYFLDLRFDKALEAGRKVVDIYPTKPMYHANYALYAMYASDFGIATNEAAKTLDLSPGYHKAYLPYAAAALVDGDLNAARTAYEKMAATGPRGASLANIGLADLALFSGDAAAADALLLQGINADAADGNNRALATKKMIRAYALWQQGRDPEEVTALIVEALSASLGMAQLVPAALLYASLGREARARDIALELDGQFDAQQRAYAKLIHARLLQEQGDYVGAYDRLQEALVMADVWLVRYYLGVTYVNAGRSQEAVSEFTICRERIGEAYSLFLNDTPTFRYTSELTKWTARAKESKTAAL